MRDLAATPRIAKRSSLVGKLTGGGLGKPTRDEDDHISRSERTSLMDTDRFARSAEPTNAKIPQDFPRSERPSWRPWEDHPRSRL